MLYLVLFLLTSIIAARFFEKHRMRTAVVFHSVLFAFLLFGLLFSVDSELVRYSFSNLLGEETYLAINHFMVNVLGMTSVHFGIVAAVWIVTLIQSMIALALAVSTIVRIFIKKALPEVLKETSRGRYIYLPSERRSVRINILYCRALN